MSYEEKRALAEDFIRGAMADLGTDADPSEIESAVEQAIRALPPYETVEA